ncbi:competence protein ComGE [Cytobacillus horneckiae]|uniref:Phosphatase n=1 Tax=Cytobacillus horneckiae TaxID=549687 RepID=A0A2N0ZHA6_9BACI|nr:hypothetical protein [Cytobacillus horneckiae]NRG47611.1 phosphatase [Bacillus sp. CRN 9]MBN6888848.1 phosphatase [Cytobacillus horneckiae]MCM3179971.1 phosphatase [Cytobacillus horneckiae]MEC1155360.1 phosphatase [Cytobacillus horneckiae]MED2936587.1 phosphatase [Cytobacillus horneckiae]
MLRKSNGIFLAELIITLAGWLVIAGVMIPLVIRAVTNSVQTNVDYRANQILYEHLSHASQTGQRPVEITLTEKGRSFELIVKEAQTPRLQVCIAYEDVFQKRVEVCEQYE